MESEEYSASISTLPINGPFYIGQTVQFTCEFNTTMSVSYQWNYVEDLYSRITRTGPSINITFSQTIYRYIWVLCTVSSSSSNRDGEISNKMIVEVHKMIEVHGKF